MKRENQINEENKKLLNNSLQMHETKDENIQLIIIEADIELLSKEIIFDTEYCNWNGIYSTFFDRIINRSKLLFLIEDNRDNKFGAFINGTIKKLKKQIQNMFWYGNDEFDEKTFIFTFKDDELIKFNMTDEISFILLESAMTGLFTIGNGDIVIQKEIFKHECYCQEESFDFGENKRILTGTYGMNEHFTVRRVTVIQMASEEEVEEWKKEHNINNK